ncbi:hypothetical protein P170DRAFT_125780 [Aspergillus steynii IBT 23096]|uniref:1,3-beta-glucanosyltransferase n=1 Tax=Aspergillus steynii IBT 23096 TaxID=1392250 RepID=A0A2I2GK12_9EURO|nr:uncharacterized protein P170DRAFT_125780 [Aspergillus steynii IBT 23096]PLB53226.1 hypothetical protein P170DRAFT_125780 [Aspergillus steynii IBT 23096]
MLPAWSWSAASLLLGSLHVRGADAIGPITPVGSKFFHEDGTQYYIKGVAYQLTPEDPLVNTDQCERDIARMAELGTNAIRVYHVDPDADHDGCMNALADAGIYLFVDLETFDTAIRTDDPQWTRSQFDSYTAVLDEFQQYNNTAGVFIGNEVITAPDNSAAAPFVLAAARDIKSYRNENHYRQIPVGYAAADIAELRPMLQNYMACRPDAADRLDFFSLNAYEWCGDSSYEESGYRRLQHQAADFPIPIFFSETGCNVARPRLFTDQSAIFSEPMSDTWSGSIIYEWIQETNDYGLITYDDDDDTVTPDAGPNNNAPVALDGFARQGAPNRVAPDFDNLKSQWATLNPTGVFLSDYIQSTAAISPPECPASTPGGWAVDPNAPLPTLQDTFHTAAPTVPSATRFPSITVSSGAGAGAGSSPTPTASFSPLSPSSFSATSFNYTLSNAGSAVAVPGQGFGLARLADGFVVFGAVVGALAVWL